MYFRVNKHTCTSCFPFPNSIVIIRLCIICKYVQTEAEKCHEIVYLIIHSSLSHTILLPLTRTAGMYFSISAEKCSF